jgi:flagellar biosynthetic protein FliQ
MESGDVVQLVASMMMLVAKISAPLLLTALVVGVLISLFQAVTQINDATLGFLPKLVVVAIAMWIALPWMLQEMSGFATQTFQLMERAGR